jgi:hypothetical protein
VPGRSANHPQAVTEVLLEGGVYGLEAAVD